MAWVKKPWALLILRWRNGLAVKRGKRRSLAAPDVFVLFTWRCCGSGRRAATGAFVAAAHGG